MKMRAVLIMAALVISIVLPLKIHLAPTDGNRHVLSLDVCSAEGSMMTVNAHMPVIHQSPCNLCLLNFKEFYRISNLQFSPLFIPFQKDRPPRV